MYFDYSQIELRILAQMARDDDRGMGEPTLFRCHCGGVMHRFDPIRAHFERLIKEMGKPRYSRRKRQAKKNHKKWKEALGFKTFLAAAMAMPLRNPIGFRCAVCGSRASFNSMLARSMFPVEPMPPGAKLVY